MLLAQEAKRQTKENILYLNEKLFEEQKCKVEKAILEAILKGYFNVITVSVNNANYKKLVEFAESFGYVTSVFNGNLQIRW